MTQAQLGLWKTAMEERFEQFHAENPEVYELFKRFAFEVIRAGRTRYSADALLHRIRWHTNVETQRLDTFKINDHWSAYYARLFESDYPEHKGLFEKRGLKAR